MQPVLSDRYLKNKNTISDENQIILASKKVLVVGLGALGGFVFEQFTRIGVGHLIGYDHDVFETSNLNRQRFSSEKNLGQFKAEVVKQQCKDINSDLDIQCFSHRFDASHDYQVLKDVDVVIEATDSIESKIQITKACKDFDIPCVVGAIGGHLGQVMVFHKDYDTISDVFQSKKQGIEHLLGNPVYTPALIASLMCKLTIDVLLDTNIQENLHYVVDLDDVVIIPIIKDSMVR